MSYCPQEIEAKWQAFWESRQTFRTNSETQKPKYYVLDMFPYPSGTGLHVGHVEGYTASDIVARFKRMKGFEVLHPMGWDAFGLPAEQFAITQGVHPSISTRKNCENFRSQLKRLGFSYDWNREIGTHEPTFYRWTQWIFLKLLEKGLAYQTEMPVNWCPALGTVLANDEVIDGKSERGGHPVIRRPMKQWMLKITAYAERLLEGLNHIDFPESIKSMQRDRIGRSEGADAWFVIDGQDERLEIFTTRPDTMFGATFCVLAPEHPLIDRITHPDQKQAVETYRADAAAKSDITRTGAEAGKSGVFTGAYARNPASGQRIPIWIADYVLMGYGTGAIMAVPGHDQRDWEFARRFSLPVREVIQGGDLTHSAFESEGLMVNSGFLDGKPSREALSAMISWLEDKGLGRRVVRYRMRDWIFARQRYWGEPIPVVHDTHGGIHIIPDDELPVQLPEIEKYQPTGTGESPLSQVKEWVETLVPSSGQPGRRETDTMPGAAGSSWYFLRFVDPGNNTCFADPALLQKWMPVDLYLGGAEHAVGHLLYSRFWTKFLYDLGLCPVDEPFRRLVNQGMILGEDSRKMSKRYGNVVNPDDVVARFGADSLRIYEMFMGPIEMEKPWSTTSLEGAARFVGRIWRLFHDDQDQLHSAVQNVEPTPEQWKLLHRSIDKISADTEGLRFNTAISQMMIFVNEMTSAKVRPRSILEPFVLVLAPFAPHLAEELWQRLGHNESLAHGPYPVADAKWLVDDTIELPVQINGKIRERLMVPADIQEDVIRELVLGNDRVREFIAGKEIAKFIYVKGRMVTIAIKG